MDSDEVWLGKAYHRSISRGSCTVQQGMPGTPQYEQETGGLLLLTAAQNLLPNTLTYLITPAVTKMGMLTVMFRIDPSRIYRAVVLSIGIAILAYTVTLTSITGGPCSPLISGTTECLENVALAQAILNIASDFAVLAVPIPTIVGLMSSTKQKVSVGCILALGSG